MFSFIIFLEVDYSRDVFRNIVRMFYLFLLQYKTLEQIFLYTGQSLSLPSHTSTFPLRSSL
jgi:hypothetical protein